MTLRYHNFPISHDIIDTSLTLVSIVEITVSQDNNEYFANFAADLSRTAAASSQREQVDLSRALQGISKRYHDVESASHEKERNTEES